MSATKKIHRHLIAGEVIFTVQHEGEELFQSAKLNGILETEFRNIGAKDIGKAQQILQAHLVNKMEGEVVPAIKDVFLHGFSYLGHQTAKEFQAAPEGMKLSVRPADSPFDPGSLN